MYLCIFKHIFFCVSNRCDNFKSLFLLSMVLVLVMPTGHLFANGETEIQAAPPGFGCQHKCRNSFTLYKLLTGSASHRNVD